MKSRLLTGLLATSLVLGLSVSPVMGVYVPEGGFVDDTRERLLPSVEGITYLSTKGTVQKIEDRENGFKYVYITSKGLEDNIIESYLVINEDTYVKGEIKVGVEVEGIYDGRLPMIMIYPPQYTATAVRVLEGNTNLKVDKFNKNGENSLISEDGSLVVNLNNDLKVVDREGNTYDKELGGKKLYVEYTMTTRSLPPQTNPELIVVLEESSLDMNIREQLEINYETIKDSNFHGNILNKLGIIKGTSKGLELNKGLTRAEGAVMYSRLLGLEEEIAEFTTQNPNHDSGFTDVPEWVKPTIDYLKYKGLIKGISDTEYGSEEFMSETQYATLVLRALGYNDTKGDFSWDTAYKTIRYIGMFDEDEVKAEDILGEEFNRRSMAYISYNALFVRNKVTGEMIAYNFINK